MCPVCKAPVLASFAAVAPRSARAVRKAVLPPLQRKPVRRGGAQAALTALLFLLIVAFGAFLYITHPWDDSRFFPQSGGDVQVAGGGIPRPAVPSADGTYHQEYEWEYGGSTWTFTMHIPAMEYQRYHAAERPTRLIEKDGEVVRQMAYDVFVTSPYDDPYVQQLADELRQQASHKGWSDDETLAFALSFVQSLPYSVDDVTTKQDEYPRFPLETLVDDGGDCEDTAILYASLVQALGYGAVLLSPPGHMAVGVKAEEGEGDAYLYAGSRYLYAETTGSAWPLGEAPDEYRGQTVQVFDLVAKPLFDLEVTYGVVTEGNMEEIELNTTAMGSADAFNVVLSAEVTSGRHIFESQKCSYAVVRPGTVLTCRLRLDLSRVPCGQEVVIRGRVLDGTYWYAREDSKPWVRSHC